MRLFEVDNKSVCCEETSNANFVKGLGKSFQSWIGKIKRDKGYDCVLGTLDWFAIRAEY
jgi:hypothetical protein